MNENDQKDLKAKPLSAKEVLEKEMHEKDTGWKFREPTLKERFFSMVMANPQPIFETPAFVLRYTNAQIDDFISYPVSWYHLHTASIGTVLYGSMAGMRGHKICDTNVYEEYAKIVHRDEHGCCVLFWIRERPDSIPPEKESTIYGKILKYYEFLK